MIQAPSSDYRRQIADWARRLARAEHTSLDGVLADGSMPRHVKMFTDGNLDKRCTKLLTQLDDVAGAFEGFEELVVAYIRGAPLAAYDTGASDGERFLRWLEASRPLTPEQRDYVRCQRGRHAVEDRARAHRFAHVRFQELSSVAAELAPRLESEGSLRVWFNPSHAWSQFETAALLDEGAAPPADVIFYAAGGDVATSVIEAQMLPLVQEFARSAPCALDAWAALSEHGDRREIVALCRDLAELGLAAVE